MIAQIETSTFCNHTCWYCQNAHYEHPEARVMPMDLFEAILKDILATFPKKRLKTVSFAAYNEPTLDPFFRDRLRMLSRFGFDYWFITNGSRMTSDLVSFLSREKPLISRFHINLPAIDPNEFHQATGAPAADIDPIRKNLAHLFESLGETGSPMSIIVHGKGDAIHVKNFKRMKEFWRDFPVRVVYQGVMNRAGMLNHIAGPAIDHGTDQVWCTARYFENLYIGVTGNLYLCCHDYYQKYSFGNMADERLEILLASKKRRAMLRKFSHDFCRHCPFAVKFAAVQSRPQKRPSFKNIIRGHEPQKEVPMPKNVLTPQAIARQALKKLRTQADPERARQVQKYFKETVRSFGIPSPAVRALAADLYSSIKKEWHYDQAFELCAILFPRPELEAKAVAALILIRFKKEFPPRLFGQVKKWLEQNYLDNWASVDTFCPEVMGVLLANDPRLVTEIKTWTGHPNRWVKRASIVSFLKLTKKQGFLDIIYEQAVKLFPVNDDLIHKANGWVLREAGKRDMQRLERFLLKHGPSIPRTTLRYAIERFPETRRRELLLETKAKPAGNE
ncbi:MAG: DNA alkylation repair protein [Candidatus Aminicenantes bacterium]|nr:DNA alkylation repair protein [Candidatus Aminicenantes bacterium]